MGNDLTSLLFAQWAAFVSAFLLWLIAAEIGPSKRFGKKAKEKELEIWKSISWSTVRRAKPALLRGWLGTCPRIRAQSSLFAILPRRDFASARSLAILAKRAHRAAICASWATRASWAMRSCKRSSRMTISRRRISA